MELGPGHHFGVWNFEVAPRFLEKLCTSDYGFSALILPVEYRVRM
jgi:hypothetical protein